MEFNFVKPLPLKPDTMAPSFLTIIINAFLSPQQKSACYVHSNVNPQKKILSRWILSI